MKVKAWSNGKKQYGVRVGVENRTNYFSETWKSIEVEIEGKIHRFALTPKFWTTCPEFRDRGQPVLREWLKKNKSLEWEDGKPPAMQLIKFGEAKFRLLP